MKSNLYALTLLVVFLTTNSLVSMTGMPRRIQGAWANFPKARDVLFSQENKRKGVSQRFYTEVKDKDTVYIAELVLHVKQGIDAKKVRDSYDNTLARQARLKKADPDVYNEVEKILTKAFNILSAK